MLYLVTLNNEWFLRLKFKKTFNNINRHKCTPLGRLFTVPCVYKHIFGRATIWIPVLAARASLWVDS